MAAGTGPGCLMYFFAICIGIMGYMPFGLHGTEFSKDSKKLIYTYNTTEVRIYDLEKHKPGEPIYTAPKGYVVDTVHRNATTDDIYAVAHNYPACEAAEKEDGSDKKIDRQFNIDILKLDLTGAPAKTLVHRTYYCPDISSPLGGGGDDSDKPKTYHAPYQKGMDKDGISFRPTGWENGELIYVEPEELTHKPATVTKMNLATGATEKLFTLPENVSSALLSPGGRYLAYVTSNKEEETYNLNLREVKSGQDIFSTALVTDAPATAKGDKSGMNPDDITQMLMMIGLFAGAEGMAAFDEQNGKFFYLTLDLKKQKTTLNQFDIAAKTKSALFESFIIAAPMPIPQRKALLLTAIDSSVLEESGGKGGPMGMAAPTLDASSGSTIALMSYDGKIIKKLDVPPVLIPLFSFRPPEYAVSPDGNLLSFSFGDQTKTGDKEKPAEKEETASAGFSMSLAPSTVMPAVIDFERGTYEVLITKPIDNFAAGISLFKMHEYKLARPYLEQFMNNFKPADPGYRRTAFSLFVIYQSLGMQKEQDALYALIHKDVIASAREIDTEFSINYIGAVTGSDMDESFNSSFNVATTPTVESLPAIEGFSTAQYEFATKELRRAESSGSARASYIIGILLTKQKKYTDAIAQFQKALDMAKKSGSTQGSGEVPAPPTDENIEPAQELELGESDTPPAISVESFQMDMGTSYNFDYLFGELCLEAGNNEQAVVFLTKYISSSNTDEFMTYTDDAYEKRADAFTALGRIDDAVKDYQFLLDKANKELSDAENDKENQYPGSLDSAREKVKGFEDKIADLQKQKK